MRASARARKGGARATRARARALFTSARRGRRAAAARPPPARAARVDARRRAPADGGERQLGAATTAGADGFVGCGRERARRQQDAPGAPPARAAGIWLTAAPLGRRRARRASHRTRARCARAPRVVASAAAAAAVKPAVARRPPRAPPRPGRHRALPRRGVRARRRRRRAAPPFDGACRAGADDRACSPAGRVVRAQPLTLREEQQPQRLLLDHQGYGSAGSASTTAPRSAERRAHSLTASAIDAPPSSVRNVGTGSVIKGCTRAFWGWSSPPAPPLPPSSPPLVTAAVHLDDPRRDRG